MKRARGFVIKRFGTRPRVLGNRLANSFNLINIISLLEGNRIRREVGNRKVRSN